MWILVCAALYLVLSLATYSPKDPGWSFVGPAPVAPIGNAGGRAGAWFADVALYLFGAFAYLIPIMVAWSAYLVFRRTPPPGATHLHLLALRLIGFLLTLAAGSALVALYLDSLTLPWPSGAGGVLGRVIKQQLVVAFNPAGSALLLIAVFFSGFTLFTGISWITAVDLIGAGVLAVVRGLLALPGWLARPFRRGAEDPVSEPDVAPEAAPFMREAPPLERRRARKQEKSRSVEPPESASDLVPTKGGPIVHARKGNFPVPVAADSTQLLPPVDLLDPVRKSGKALSAEALEALSRMVEFKLADFGVEAQVVAVYPGPVVILFELQLAPGTKVSKITSLSKDLARALSTISVRVVEVIPGKSVIGLEVPNETRETVYLSEVLRSKAYNDARSPLTIGVGVDIAGRPVVADLARMPHTLIAGTTGSGKSVAINAMILSLVFKATPRDVRLIMVDPKMLELSVYEGIPHLLTPVVTDMKEAANALRWCVAEMEHRYRLMAKLGVRNIAGFNRKIADAEESGEPIPDPLFVADPMLNGSKPEVPPLEHLPYIVVIIDELADLMMVVGKKVEELIARLAQKARASGIHLLLATQRPSVDVLTGLIKANIPTRMAFQVSARVDSRVIIDQMGAEHLLGHGDMLYVSAGTSFPERIHGAFVDDHEVHRVVDYLKQFGEPEYIDTILQETAERIPGLDPEPNGDLEDQDPLYDEAVRIVTETRRASISGVQRRLKIGYNRAARLIEEMERIGIVGAAETNGSREVLVPPPPDA